MHTRSIAGFTLAVILHASFGSATAQDDGWYYLDGALLSIGDPAPKLMVQEFVLGEAVAEFKRGKVYVIEFWKCGCPPCRAAIPYLNELQKKYPAVIFISVGVLTPTTDNKEFAKKISDRVTYRVAVDRVPPGKDPWTSGAMVQGWLEPAGQDGVPTSFVVDGYGRIAWIGHPMDLDDAKAGKPLKKIVAGKWDLKSAAVKFASRPRNNEAARQRVDKLPETERDAIKALQKRVRRVVVGIQRSTVTSARFDPSRVTDSTASDLANELQKLKGLQELDLCGTEITDAGLKKLRELKTLQYLDLSYVQVTDAGLKELREWKDLRRLTLNGSHVTEAGLKELKSMAKLQSLNLSGLEIKAAGLKDLKELPQLHNLDLSHTGITDVMLKQLQGMDELHGLNLSNTQITDAGLKELKGLKLGR
jgi:thiol-disulfide isomerase/thioredoxin